MILTYRRHDNIVVGGTPSNFDQNRGEVTGMAILEQLSD